MDNTEEVKRLYGLIKVYNEQIDPYTDVILPEIAERRVNIIARLEEILGCEFRNTKDFQYKILRYLSKEEHWGTKLKRARQTKGWSQASMALYLSVSPQCLSQMEHGRKLLNRKALEFVDKLGIPNHVE